MVDKDGKTILNKRFVVQYLYMAGYTKAEIAKVLGYKSSQYVTGVLHRAGVKQRNPSQARTTKKLRLDSFPPNILQAVKKYAVQGGISFLQQSALKNPVDVVDFDSVEDRGQYKRKELIYRLLMLTTKLGDNIGKFLCEGVGYQDYYVCTVSFLRGSLVKRITGNKTKFTSDLVDLDFGQSGYRATFMARLAYSIDGLKREDIDAYLMKMEEYLSERIADHKISLRCAHYNEDGDLLIIVRYIVNSTDLISFR